jgi:hypothetical protein
MIDRKRLDEIQARCDAAEAGPWEIYDKDKHPYQNGGLVYVHLNSYECLWGGYDDTMPDGETIAFIAHARTDLPDCVAEIRRLREELSLAIKVHTDYVNNK